MAPAIESFASRCALMGAAADRIEAALREGLAGRGVACAALAGGTTPGPAYTLLAARDLDWSKVTFALTDERRAPANDPASNEHMLRQTLARPLEQGARLAPMNAPNANAHYAALDFDIAVLGMGADGHTLSWFAGSAGLAAALDPANPLSVVAIEAPGAAGSANRLTLTRSALARARHIILLIHGDDKRRVLEQNLRDKSAPVAALFEPPLTPPCVLWAA